MQMRSCHEDAPEWSGRERVAAAPEKARVLASTRLHLLHSSFFIRFLPFIILMSSLRFVPPPARHARYSAARHDMPDVVVMQEAATARLQDAFQAAQSRSRFHAPLAEREFARARPYEVSAEQAKSISFHFMTSAPDARRESRSCATLPRCARMCFIYAMRIYVRVAHALR